MNIVLKSVNDQPFWIYAVPYFEGRLPGFSDEARRYWLRLDQIQRVAARLCLEVSDPRECEYGIVVHACGELHYLSRDLFKVYEATEIVHYVLEAVAAAVRVRT